MIARAPLKCISVSRLTFIVALAVCLALSGGAAAADAKADARAILDATGVKGGLIVHVGCGAGRLTAALRANDSYLVHGLDTDAANVDKARKCAAAQKLYGVVAIDRFAGEHLPYIDNLVNLVVAADLGKVPVAEVMRVLRPNGVAYIGGKKTVKPRPREIDEWTHYMHDAGGNAVAHDTVIGPPRRVQWVGSPRWARHHDHMSSVSAVVTAAGRVFTIFDEGSRASILLPPKWKLIARDAFNGTILWKRPIARWYTHMLRLKSGPAVLPRRLVAVGDRVYVTLGIDAPLTVLDGATGETIRTYKNTKATQEVLVSDGTIFVVVDDRPAATAQNAALWAVAERRITAINAESGKVLWKLASPILPMTLAADANGVYFHDGEKAVALDRASGKQKWTSKPLARWNKLTSYYGATLLVCDGIVLFSGGAKMVPHRGGKDTMTALSAKTGKEMWTADHPPSGYQSPEDMFVAQGRVWVHATTNGGYTGKVTGHNLKTGEVEAEFLPDVKNYWFHHRCHRGKATDKYLLSSRTGIEFIDIAQKHWDINHWVRGACLYGVMPANGLIYAAQHPCACYPEAKLNGFNALAPAGRTTRETASGRLEKGPAYGTINRQSSIVNRQSDDWPTFRHDATRSGHTPSAVPAAGLKSAWRTTLGGRLTAPTLAGGKIFVASIDTHTVHAIDSQTGKPAWRYTAGGRVDSPPTIWQGRVLFGSADGYVYCLRATDGALAWRFRAAPQDKRTVSYEQVESVWPVPGSVLVCGTGVSPVKDQHGQDARATIWCVAGRSIFLDGGLRLLQLDPRTGRKIAETVMDHRDPGTGKSIQERIQVLNMPVGLPDILTSDGRHVYMKSQVFDMTGKRLALGPHSGNPAGQGSVQQGPTAHVFCPSGFLDDSWWHRTYWVYGRSFAGGHGGYFQAGKFAPAGRILVFDDTTVYGFGRKAKYYRWTTPLEHHLFADTKGVPRSAGGRRRGPAKTARGPWVSVANTRSLDPTGKALAVEAWVRADRPAGVILARGGPAQGYALVLNGGKPRFVIRSDNETSSVEADRKVVGKWVHLTGVLTKDKKLKVFIDGKLAAAGKAAKLIASEPKQAMEIGADAAGSVGDYPTPFALSGLVDEVRVFHGTVTDAEIAAHSVVGGKVAAKDAKLVLCLTFDGGKGADVSGLKNDGQIGALKSAKGKFGDAVKLGAAGGKGKPKRTNRPAPRTGLKHKWAHDVPLWPRAMVLADKTLFIAGPPDIVNEDEVHRRMGDPAVRKKLAEQDAALLGARGAALWAVSAEDGTKLAEYKLDFLPVFDGMIASGGRLYIVTKGGAIVCMGK